MSAAAASEAPASRIGAIRFAGALLVLASAALIAASPEWLASLRESWFDATHRLAPREVRTLPATIVEIDAKSLSTLGRWPWPRSLLAELVSRVSAHEPAAVGIDILMPDPDPLSPERLLQHGSSDAVALVRELGKLPSNDTLLARALAKTPAVLAVAGLPDPTGMPLRAPPFVVRDTSTSAGVLRATELSIVHFGGALTSVDDVNRAASGWGLVSADPARGVVRRVPLVAEVDGTLIAAMAIEMVRLAAKRASLQLLVSGRSVDGIAIGGALIATEPDGGVRPYLSRRDPRRFVSAVDVLQDRFDPEQLRQQFVLIAVTGLALADYHYTPVGERMPGSEIHAQLLENLNDGTLLRRPAWGAAAEAATFVLLGVLLVWFIPLGKPARATLLLIVALGVLVGASYAAFRSHRLLFDAATPAIGLMLAFATLLVLSLAEAARMRRALDQVLQSERERSARMAGELDAARRVQMATLPRAEPLCDERLDLAASMAPAREVGGDLYDFFRLDERRVFLLVGDVAGKGLSASIFMAVSKALYKSAALRAAMPDMGALMAAANAEIARDNPDMLFVSAFAAVLDLESGEVAYCNAGHENPWLVHASDASARRIVDGDGPPLCVVDDFAYGGARLRLRPGEIVCIVTDGVTEAQDRTGTLYGHARLESLLERLRTKGRSAQAIIEAVRDDVASFTGGAEPSDDMTVLVLRWRGLGAPRAT